MRSAHAGGRSPRPQASANLFLTHRADGSACIKVIDFGLSRVLDARGSGAESRMALDTDVLGSPHYMAPEQLRAASLTDSRADIWSLGAVLHGAHHRPGRPSPEKRSPAVCAAVLTRPATPMSAIRPNVPPSVERAVLQCLQKDPEARFATVGEMARAVAGAGTSMARASCERIDRILDDSGRPQEIALPPAPHSSLAAAAHPSPNPVRLDFPADESHVATDPGAAEAPTADALDDDWEADRRIFQAPASGRLVAGALLIMGGLGAAVFMGLYASVHGSHEFPTAIPTLPAESAATATDSTVALLPAPPSLLRPLTATPTPTVQQLEPPPPPAPPPRGGASAGACDRGARACARDRGRDRDRACARAHARACACACACACARARPRRYPCPRDPRRRPRFRPHRRRRRRLPPTTTPSPPSSPQPPSPALYRPAVATPPQPQPQPTPSRPTSSTDASKCPPSAAPSPPSSAPPSPCWHRRRGQETR